MDSDYISEIFSQVGVQDLTAGPVIALALAVLLLFASGFISASEVAFFSLKPNDINRIKEGNHPADSVILDLPNNSEFLLATILIANNFVNVAIVMLCTYGINEWLDFSNVPMLGFVLETIVLTFLLLLFGEIMPKIYAKQNTLPFIHKAAPTLLNIQKICKPLAALLVHSTSTINKTLAKKKYDISVDELSKALELTSKAIPEEKEMLAEIIKFYNKTADEIMTSRLDMEDLDIKANFKEVIDTIIKCGYSRIPVYSGTEDNIKGFLYIKDLLPYLDKPETFRWQSLIRPAYFVPETKKIDDLLEEFRTNKIHMAIVVDEFGGTSGLVTMEDIIEEIVGEIHDEYDDEERTYVVLNDHTWIFEAKTQLTDFYKIAKVDEDEFERVVGDADTLAGMLLEIKGEFPALHEKVTYHNYEFEVLEMDSRRILKVKFTILPKEETEGAEDKE